MSDTIDGVTRPVPRWLASAPNRSRALVFEGCPRRRRRPYRLQHARRVGALVTACGFPATEWQMFWDLPFPAELRATCSDCRDEVLMSEILRGSQLRAAAPRTRRRA